MGSSKKITFRKLVVYLAALAVLFFAKPEVTLYVVGLILVGLGELMRLWGCGHLRKNKDVITSGPFAHVKHPLYLGSFLVFSGFCFQASNPGEPSRYILYVIFPFFLAVFFFYYLPYKAQVEGDRLRKRFGEKYDEYARNVPGFIPRWKPWGHSTQKWDMALLAENSEWGIFLILIVGSTLIFTKFFPFSRFYDVWTLF